MLIVGIYNEAGLFILGGCRNSICLDYYAALSRVFRVCA